MRLGAGAPALSRDAHHRSRPPSAATPASARRATVETARAFSGIAEGRRAAPVPALRHVRKARKALMRPYSPRAERALAALLEETAEGLGEAPPHDVAFSPADVPTELGGCEKVVWFASSAADVNPGNGRWRDWCSACARRRPRGHLATQVGA